MILLLDVITNKERLNYGSFISSTVTIFHLSKSLIWPPLLPTTSVLLAEDKPILASGDSPVVSGLAHNHFISIIHYMKVGRYISDTEDMIRQIFDAKQL